MPHTPPFIQWRVLPDRQEPDALFGFSVPFLPDVFSSPWFTGSNRRERLYEVLRAQMGLLQALWRSGTPAPIWDLRFVGSDEAAGVAIALLCRLQRPVHLHKAQFHNFCLAYCSELQQLFANVGYEVVPLSDERSLARYVIPFHFAAVAEVRRNEELCVFESTYVAYEAYVPYPWSWTLQNRLRLFETLVKRQSNCLVSIYLEPTRLTEQEHWHLQHATSQQMREMLSQSGPAGENIYNVYKDLQQCLRQPYLLRIGIAASSQQTLYQVGNALLDELHTSQSMEQMQQENFVNRIDASEMRSALCFPRNSAEMQWASRNIATLECIPWGHNLGVNLPGTARLRYLVDVRMASMAFRLPVTNVNDAAGVPVRAFTGGQSLSSGPFAHTTPVQASDSTTVTSMTNALTEKRTPQEDSQFDPQQPRQIIGKRLGSCQIEALLGRGGFGAVYRAQQTHLGRLVAVKLILALSTDLSSPAYRKALQRFAHEAQAVARLDHPHILALYEYQASPVPYIVMPYIPNGSLRDELCASGYRPWPVHRIAVLLRQVASGLDHAHAHGLVHRDIKPDNLLRHADGRILISDFGAVQFSENELTALTVNAESSPLTPAYASPEQHLEQRIDSRSDIYSLGIVVYELLCGHRPFTQVYAHVHSVPPPFHSFGVQVSAALEAVVGKALAKKPEQRYASAGVFAEEFQVALMK